MKLKVLNKNSSGSKPLIDRTRGAVNALKLKAKIEEIFDSRQIDKYGIKHTPGLVINDRVVLQGRVPEMQKIQDILIHEARLSKSK